MFRWENGSGKFSPFKEILTDRPSNHQPTDQLTVACLTDMSARREVTLLITHGLKQVPQGGGAIGAQLGNIAIYQRLIQQLLELFSQPYH